MLGLVALGLSLQVLVDLLLDPVLVFGLISTNHGIMTKKERQSQDLTESGNTPNVHQRSHVAQ